MRRGIGTLGAGMKHRSGRSWPAISRAQRAVVRERVEPSTAPAPMVMEDLASTRDDAVLWKASMKSKTARRRRCGPERHGREGSRVGAIFRVDENDVPWAEYEQSAGDDRRAQVRYKALTVHDPDVPPVQYVEYAPGHADPMHSHRTDEVLIVTAGELWLDDVENGPGSVVF